jgi:hypothetical protein
VKIPFRTELEIAKGHAYELRLAHEWLNQPLIMVVNRQRKTEGLGLGVLAVWFFSNHVI